MSAELLQSVGKSLYGLQWQSDLARALGVSDRTVRHWVQGGVVSDEKWRQLACLCYQRKGALDQAINSISIARGVPWDYVMEKRQG